MNRNIEQLMQQRFSKDCIIALATSQGSRPWVREVDAFYENGCFYFITCPDSHKIQQMEDNPEVAVAGEWFSGHGHARILGDYEKPENVAITRELEEEFSWFDPRREDWNHPYTQIVEVQMEDGELTDGQDVWELDFQKNH